MANGNNVLDAGDLITMGQYPTNLAATSFASWGVTSHTVGSVYDYHVNNADSRVWVYSSDGGGFDWVDAYDLQSPLGQGHVGEFYNEFWS